MGNTFKSAPVRFGSVQARPPFAGRGQRIGLLGGSFNPPHQGHVTISTLAKRRLELDAVWWLVSPGNPLKSHAELLPQTERIALCQAMVPPWLKVTGFEAALPTAYTAATLAFLRHRYPTQKFVWLMGADNLATFHRWRDWRWIGETFPFVVADRPGHHLSALASPAARALSRGFRSERFAPVLANQTAPAWAFISGRLSGLSSTEIRQRKT